MNNSESNNEPSKLREEFKQLQEAAAFLKEKMRKVDYVYRTLQNFGEPDEIRKILEKIKSADQILDKLTEKYKKLEQEIDALNSFISQEKKAIRNIQETLDELNNIKSSTLEKVRGIEETGGRIIEKLESFGGLEGLNRLTAEVDRGESFLNQLNALENKTASDLEKIQENLRISHQSVEKSSKIQQAFQQQYNTLIAEVSQIENLTQSAKIVLTDVTIKQQKIRTELDKITEQSQPINDINQLIITVKIQEEDLKILNKKILKIQDELNSLRQKIQADEPEIQANKNNYQILKDFVIKLHQKQQESQRNIEERLCKLEGNKTL